MFLIPQGSTPGSHPTNALQVFLLGLRMILEFVNNNEHFSGFTEFDLPALYVRTDWESSMWTCFVWLEVPFSLPTLWTFIQNSIFLHVLLQCCIPSVLCFVPCLSYFAYNILCILGACVHSHIFLNVWSVIQIIPIFIYNSSHCSLYFFIQFHYPKSFSSLNVLPSKKPFLMSPSYILLLNFAFTSKCLHFFMIYLHFCSNIIYVFMKKLLFETKSHLDFILQK